MMRHESLFWLYIINDIEQKAEHFPDGMFNRKNKRLFGISNKTYLTSVMLGKIIVFTVNAVMSLYFT